MGLINVDLAIVGAGPAGLAAAVESSNLGLNVMLLDEQAQPGGQIYRGIETNSSLRKEQLEMLGPDYFKGFALTQAFRSSRCEYSNNTQVWQVEPSGRLFYRREGVVGQCIAKKILIATGAMERPMPLPGWTLPGVMTCGAAQTLLKSHALVPQGRFILAGCGPLLLLLAVQLIRAGIKPVALLETNFHVTAALAHWYGFLRTPEYLFKGLSLIREIKNSGVPIYKRVKDIVVLGDSQVRKVRFSEDGAAPVELLADHVFLHQGVVPNGNLALSLNLDHEWCDRQRCFSPKKDIWGKSSIDSIYVAGDAAGILGAKGAQALGEVAAFGIARDLGLISMTECNNLAYHALSAIEKHQAARPFLDTLYRPADVDVVPSLDETIVCRCEEVSAGDIRRLVNEQHCTGPNQMKSFIRCGMGACQGRLCGLTVVELMAQSRGRPVSEVGYYRIRAPIKPVTVGELASLEVDLFSL